MSDRIHSYDDETRKEIANELRSIADRIEDGEYPFTSIEMSYPSGGEAGHVKLEFIEIENLREWHARFYDE